MKRRLKLACEFPSKADLDWMETHIQRHTGGFKAWWAQATKELSGREIIQAIISVWEAGRGGKRP